MYKPVAFVSHGGISVGLPSVQMLKQVVTSLHMIPLTEAVTIPTYAKFINDEDEFKPDEIVLKSAETVLS
ncbi:MAG: hypothetical protein JWQ14_2542 [Adhaeribacter sp.]|jgi:NAD(P)H-dependent FMN reductase|nr:hypothetical protein [Adhaeribacter sp.]